MSTVCLYVKRVHFTVRLEFKNMCIFKHTLQHSGTKCRPPSHGLQRLRDLPRPRPRDPQAAHSAESHRPSPCPSHCPPHGCRGHTTPWRGLQPPSAPGSHSPHPFPLQPSLCVALFTASFCATRGWAALFPRLLPWNRVSKLLVGPTCALWRHVSVPPLLHL